MPTPKTISTELSVGFGLLDDDPVSNTFDDIYEKFSGTLPSEDFETLQIQYSRKPKYYRRFWNVGQNLRTTYFAQRKIPQVSWEGYRQQATTVSVPKDLMVAGTAISVKADSNVIYNRSPHMMFISLPEGSPQPGRAEDWFLTVAPREYQSLYEYARGLLRPEFPANVADLKKATNAADRRSFAMGIRRLKDRKDPHYSQRYLKLCHAVAQESARMFNENLSNSLASSHKNYVEESILRTFFRVGDSEYILCGLDGSREFSVLVPDLTEFKRNWAIKQIEAVPLLDKGQSEVRVDFELTSKRDRNTYKLHFHIEVRWSHGPFVNSPEGKLYKDFKWSDVAFFRSLYEQPPYTRGRIIGKGAYGVIYEATMPKGKKPVAIKEFSRDASGFMSSSDDRQRFSREVELQAKLDHPNILPILEHDTSARQPWFASPLADQNLEEMLPDLREDVPRTVEVLRQILVGLNFAHSQNVIHRDLKPSNILIFRNDVVKIGDFGLGKQIDAAASGGLLTQTSSNSMGTLAYCAPEQLASFRDADERADIYAFGKTFLHVITGEVPDGPFLTVDNEIDFDSIWKPVIMKCIELDPNQRYQSVSHVLDDYDRIVRENCDTT